jgi:preprotein translocase subunit Sec61beta
MTGPIAVEVREGAGYIRYSNSDIAQTIDIVPSCSVAADLAVDGTVVGIEILDVASNDQVEAASRFAAAHSLAFPRDLNGALASV